MSRSKLLREHSKIEQSTPSLGARAGKHYAKIQTIFTEICEVYGLDAVLAGTAIPHYVAQHVKALAEIRTYRQPDRHISVAAVAKPEPDLKKLARALWALAEQRRQAELRHEAADELDAA